MSSSTRCLIAGGPTRTRTPFPFLQLPGETRNQIYLDLFGGPKTNKDCAWWERDLCDTSQVFAKKPKRSGIIKCSGLVVLMRTCRSLYVEVSAFLYHQGRFVFSPHAMGWNIDFLLHGPGRHLRSVVVQFRNARLPGAHWWPVDVWEPIGDLPYEERLLRAIAEKARRLEHLEIRTIGRQHYPPIPRNSVLECWGVDIEFPNYSWVDPPIRLPGLCAGEVPRYPSEEQLAAILDYLVPGDDAKQLLVKGLMGHDSGPNRLSFWDVIWRGLGQMTEQQLFWQQMVSVFEDMSPTLRTLDWVGVVDTRWMTALADAMNVTVRGRLTNDSDDWVTVEPSSPKE